jgi:molybdenum cofactor cytidylyltransferase
MSVAAIILAAGRGTRFGQEPKLLAAYREKPIVRHVAEAACASAATPVLVVTGHRAGEVRRSLDGLDVAEVPNSSFAKGLSTSLKAGFAALPPDAEAAIVLLGDMPRIGTPLIDGLVARWRVAGRPAAVVPTFEGRPGNPVVLSRMLEADIRALTGDAGAGPLLRLRGDVDLWPVDDPAIVQDVDTVDGLRSLPE